MAWLGAAVFFGVGLVLGLLGAGGGTLAVPVLVWVLGQDPHQAVAGSALLVGVAAAAAAWPHVRAGRVHKRSAVTLGAGGMVGAFAGGSLASLLPPGVLLALLGLLLAASSVSMLGASPTLPPVRPAPSTPSLVRLGWGGLLIGLLSGMVGVGGGFMLVPALVQWGGLPMVEAVATSLVVVALQSLAALLGHWSGVTLDLPWLWGLAAAAVAGSVAGGRLGARLPAHLLRQAFGLLVLSMGVWLVDRQAPLLAAGRHAVSAGLAVAVGLAVAWRRGSATPA